MKNPIRLGLIGCGGIVQQQHLPTLIELDEVEISALADPMEDNLASVGQTTGVHTDQRYTDYRDMLSRENIDAAIIATPHNLHAQQAIDAIYAGLTELSA